ncbi:coiled-coil domain-containing protein 18 isoform X1 [Xiphophorus hellerii]|uniref:coiled-coil domain-containing protein 18 isoform X1 n=1 Tax=Xiphophorus hellerii TaxID=8084 RepID=UPI0013B38B10|nr:coiled-coil domain-containing protein 18 isoform X1 [Xiphophorus hellerii]XP_032421585.1 coiled-coil domain-containing protein 18 isoform X1 [Xiphophorus hellerii]XP_032421586.1 coiled-coil domain-containing protein 18 isoform X1 [Xiphophorus hellerii]
MASAAARKKGGCVRQENACLIADERFRSNLDALQFEPEASDLQVHHSLSGVMVSSSMAAMSEHIHQLEAELEAQTEELKAAELRAESCQEAAVHSEAVVATVTEELRMLREELESRTATGKRAEQQRNQALQNAEKLKEAFNDYKDTFSIKLRKVVESETTLKESLMGSDREKQELEVKFSALERERAEQSQTVSQLQEELRQGGAAAALLQAQLEQVARRASQLEQQLSEQGAECREAASVRREVEELRTLTRDQEQKVTQTQAELSALEAVLALLHLQEAPAGPICSNPCMLPPVDYSGAAHLLKLKPGEGYQQLLRVLQVKEAERLKQQSQKERLQERLSRAQEEISALQNSMAQRASHYQNLHTELLERGSQATDAQKELKRKSARVAALEKQLQEKSSAYSLAALKNTALENELKEKSSSVQHYQVLMSRKQKEHQKALDQCKQSHSKQLAEQQHRIEMLQLSVEESLAQMLELEQQLGSVQTERDKAQKAALLLQTSLDQLSQEKQVEVRHNQEMLQSFKDQATHSATMVSELQSCLSVCKEELNSQLQQMEELKRNHQTELQRKNEKVHTENVCQLVCQGTRQLNTHTCPLSLLLFQMSRLQEKLHSTSLVCQSSSEQNLQLQESLQQQQTMLTESTARVSELEESQSQLQRQVSGLELQLERAWASLQDEVRSRGLEAQAAERNLQEATEQNGQLSKSISHLTLKMEKLEVELEHLRSQVAAKAEQIVGLEQNLQCTKSQVITKTSTVEELEEKLHRCEEERLCSMQRVKILEGELHSVQAELGNTVERLQELQDVLQRTQTVSDQRQAQVDKLGLRLSETQRELEERTHEVLDMDNALKETQEELQQRAKLLSQLDEAIREHKLEMDRKVEVLQQELTQRNAKESEELNQQLSECEQRLQEALDELEASRRDRDALSRELDRTKLQIRETEAQLRSAVEELLRKESGWLQEEERLQSTLSALEQELELEKEQHSKELESLQHTRGQLLKVSEQISSTMRSSQEQLTAKLQQSQAHLEEARAQCGRVKAQLDQAEIELDYSRSQAGHLQAQLDQSQAQLLQSRTELEDSKVLCEQTRVQSSHLHAQLELLSAQLQQSRTQVSQLQTQLQTSEKSAEMSVDSLLIKESEVTRLQARISSLGRAAERRSLCSHSPSLTEPPEPSFSSQPSLPSFRLLPASVCLSPHSHPGPLRSPTHDWPKSASLHSSTDLPRSLRGALIREPWDSSSASGLTFPGSADQSWRGLSSTEASFDPLTYMADEPNSADIRTEAPVGQQGDNMPLTESRRESEGTLVGEDEGEVDMSSLTGMLRFVNQTLAMQQDSSPWSPIKQTQT